MVSGRTQIADVDAMLARWRDSAGADWQAAFRGRLEAHGRAFREHGNPLDAWTAILLARALGEAPPQWTLDYLAMSATNIYDLQFESMAGNVIKPAEIAWALDMVTHGPGTAFLAPKAFDWIAIGMQVRNAMKAGVEKTSALVQVADANDISQSKALTDWKRFEAEYPEQL